ncbi:MAG TPA: amidase [Pseudomonadales bacterium]|nr:amidase [Pseudomonadales bacterium]HNC69645.1 amidase [Pseudomonadales bacterium]HND13440.1 amidase [Pseudomonadales bacterium]
MSDQQKTFSRREFVTAATAVAAAATLVPPGAAAAGTSARALRDYMQHDATGLAELVRRREVSPAELLELAIARAEAVNGAINALCLKHYGEARAALKNIDPRAPLAGVPFLLKDLGVYLEGTVTSNGSRFFRDRVATQTSTVVRRYQAAGLNIFGKTTSPEFGQIPNTVSSLYGKTRNPWNLEYSAGGSSGGSAAAVAAGVLPAAHATDGGGSIRFPAAMCGLVGLKPTRARTPLGPNKSEGWSGLSCGHVVSRSLRDSALLLDLTQGAEPGAAYWPPKPEDSYVSELKREPGRLRIAVISRSPLGASVHQDNLDALANARKLLDSLGHEVFDAELPADFQRYMDSFGVLSFVGVCSTIRDRARELGHEPGPDDLEPIVYGFYQQGGSISALDYESARQAVQRLGFAISRFMENIDVLLMPMAARAPWKVDDIVLTMEKDVFYREALGYSDFSAIFNCTGQPAITLPLTVNAAGIPVGTHFAARYGDEKTLIRLAAQIEQAAPWQQRVSPMLAKALRA